MGGGGAKSRRRESLVLYKTFSTLWVHLSPADRLNNQCWLFASMRIRIHCLLFPWSSGSTFSLPCGSGFIFTSMKLRIRLFTSIYSSSGYWSSSTIRESPTLASTALFWASLAPGEPPWLHCEPPQLPGFQFDVDPDPWKMILQTFLAVKFFKRLSWDLNRSGLVLW